MFYYLRGEVALIDLGMVVLDCGGVGFGSAAAFPRY